MGEDVLGGGVCLNDRYELEDLLGRGGMGEVWRARHLALNSPAAIKFLHAGSVQDDVARARFLTEAQVTAQLKTRHAVQVFDFGVTAGGRPYLVMELLDGETIGHRIERLGQLSTTDTVRFLQQAARALDQAHALGIVHRDFKPDNLVVVRDEVGREFIKVLDFGIAKLVGDLEASSEQVPPPSSRALDDATLVDEQPPMSLTASNSFLGTPPYMAPEQIRRDRTLGASADIWAFGVVAFECLTGQMPFAGTTLIEVFTRIQTGERLRARDLRPDLPAEFEEWVSMACAAAPKDRFTSALVAARALAVSLESRRWASDRPSAAPPSDPPPPLFAGPGSSESVPVSTGARLLSRQRRTLGDTNEPVSRPIVPPGVAPSPPTFGPRVEPPSLVAPPRAKPLPSTVATLPLRERRSAGPLIVATAFGALAALGLAAWWNAHDDARTGKGPPARAVASTPQVADASPDAPAGTEAQRARAQ